MHICVLYTDATSIDIIDCYCRYKKKSAARDFASKSAIDKVAVLGHSATSDLVNKKLALTGEGMKQEHGPEHECYMSHHLPTISSGSIMPTYQYQSIDDSKPRTRANSTLSEEGGGDILNNVMEEKSNKKSKKEKKEKKDKK